MVEWRGVYTVLVGKSVGKRILGRPRHRGEDSINVDIQEVEIQTRPKPLDFFCVKNPQHAFLRRGN
jgi:hypothetical protein